MRFWFLVVILLVASAPVHAQHDVDGDGRVTILFPISYHSDIDEPLPGGYGSLWSVDVWIHNGTSRPLGAIQDYPCEVVCSFLHPPHTSETMILSAGMARGGLVSLPVDVAPSVSFTTRLFEHSRRSQPNGVETPVVWEESFLTGQTRLVAVPSRADSRVALRVYDPFPTTTPKEVRADFVSREGTILASTVLSLTLPLQSEPYMAGYGAIGDIRAEFPAIQDEEIFDIVLTPSSPEAPYYALASDTDRDTQNVLLITPSNR